MEGKQYKQDNTIIPQTKDIVNPQEIENCNSLMNDSDPPTVGKAETPTQTSFSHDEHTYRKEKPSTNQVDEEE